MGAAAGHLYGGHVERLREDGAIDVIAVELAEGRGPDVGRSEDGLVQVGAGGGLVVAVRQERGLRAEGGCEEAWQRKSGRKSQHP